MIHRSAALIHPPDLRKRQGGSLLLIHPPTSHVLTCTDPLIHLDPPTGGPGVDRAPRGARRPPGRPGLSH